MAFDMSHQAASWLQEGERMGHMLAVLPLAKAGSSG